MPPSDDVHAVGSGLGLTPHLGRLDSGVLLGFARANGNIVRGGGSYEVA
ncbi:hypothetical protein [Streptomyces sp. NBC_01314]|nr:hypothetical protein OG622_30910 [Streptomyces sp. NBC_01314]